MSIRTILVGLLAIVCGASAALGVSHFRNQNAAPAAAAAIDVTKVPVAAVDIARGDEIIETMLVEREWPTKLIPAGTILSKKELIGKIAETALFPNEPFIGAKVGDSERFSGMVRKGMRAYTILTPNDASLVAGLIEPGDKVDVLFTNQQSEKEFTGGGSTTPLLQNIEVMAIGRELDSKQGRTDKETRSVTLSVTLDMATKLALAQRVGTLHLALRSEQDQVTANADTITLAELMRTMYPALSIKEEEEEAEAAAASAQPVAQAEPAPSPEVRREIVVRTLRGFVPSEMVMNVSNDGSKREHLMVKQ